jgi:tight adherence protein C
MSADNLWVMLAIFGAVSSLVLLVGLVIGGRGKSVDVRLENVAGTSHQRRPSDSGRPTRSPLPRVGAMLVPTDESKLSRLTVRLQQAGWYRKHSTAVYLGLKVLLMCVPMVVGLGLASSGLTTLPYGIIFGAFVGLLGNVVPSIWIGILKSDRQKKIRRSMPDALDVIVICMEGGLSLSASFDRVARELKQAHPLLAEEMAIVQREIQLGRSTGVALRQFADRFDAEELRSLASVVIQAEKYGASITKAMRVHAESLRLRRYQKAEAEAQKAPVKLIFPTVLFIFPALYIVLMGPAGVALFQILEKF